MADNKFILIAKCKNTTLEKLCETVEPSCFLSAGMYWFDSAGDRETARLGILSSFPAAEFTEIPETTKPLTEESDESSV